MSAQKHAGRHSPYAKKGKTVPPRGPCGVGRAAVPITLFGADRFHKGEGAGFRHDTNKISIIDKNGKTDYPLKSKREVATDIIDRLVQLIK